MEVDIKNEIYLEINKYKNGTEQESKIGNKIEEFANTIKCFRCLDTKETWYYRGEEYKKDGKGEYCKFSCPVCLSEEQQNKWIEDSKTSDLVSSRNIKIFNRNNHSGTERFNSLKKYIISNYPEIIVPKFKTSKSNNIKENKSTKKLDIEVGNIINKCKNVLELSYSNLSSITNLINDIRVNISKVDEDFDEDNKLCDKVDENTFVFINIKNKSTQKSSRIDCICNSEKYNLDIDINIIEIVTLNDSATIMCENIINKNADQNINFIKSLFANDEDISNDENI